LLHETFYEMKAVFDKNPGEKVVDAFRILLRRKPYDYKDIAETAKRDFNELRDIFARTASSIPFSVLPSDVIAQL